jgi:hypothetical protein
MPPLHSDTGCDVRDRQAFRTEKYNAAASDESDTHGSGTGSEFKFTFFIISKFNC